MAQSMNKDSETTLTVRLKNIKRVNTQGSNGRWSIRTLIEIPVTETMMVRREVNSPTIMGTTTTWMGIKTMVTSGKLILKTPKQ